MFIYKQWIINTCFTSVIRYCVATVYIALTLITSLAQMCNTVRIYAIPVHILGERGEGRLD